MLLSQWRYLQTARSAMRDLKSGQLTPEQHRQVVEAAMRRKVAEDERAASVCR